MLIVLCGLAPSLVVARDLEVESRTDLQLQLGNRRLNLTGVSDADRATDLFLVGGSELTFAQGSFELKFRPELRWMGSTALSLPEADPARLSLRPPKRFLPLETHWSSRSSGELDLQLSQATLRYRRDNVELQAGRSPVSLGVLRVLPLWNKFTRPLPVTSGITLVESQDGLGLRYQLGDWALREIIILGQDASEAVGLTEATWYSDFAEFHALAGFWWENLGLGFALAKDLGGMTLRGEFLRVGLRASDPDPETQLGFGLEYAFNEDWSIVSEFLYFSAAAGEKADYTPPRSTRFRPLAARVYGFAQVRYQLSSYWALSGGALANGIDPSAFAILKAEHSLSDHADLAIEATAPFGPDGGEFSARPVGPPAQLSAALRYYF